MANILCIGAGYVGGPTMVVIAKHCPQHRVVVVDTNAERIAAWNSDRLPIYEPGLDEGARRSRAQPLLLDRRQPEHRRSRHHLRQRQHRDEDLRPGRRQGRRPAILGEVPRQILENSTSSKIVVEKSTLPVRTAEAMEYILNAAEPRACTSTSSQTRSSWLKAPPSRISSAPTVC